MAKLVFQKVGSPGVRVSDSTSNLIVSAKHLCNALQISHWVLIPKGGDIGDLIAVQEEGRQVD